MTTIESFYAQIFSRPIVVWLLLLGGSLALSAFLKLALNFLSRRISAWTAESESLWDDVIPDLFQKTKGWVLFVWIFSTAARSYNTSFSTDKVLKLAAVTATIVQIGAWSLRLLAQWKRLSLDPRIKQDRSSAAALSMFYTGIRTGALLILFLIGLSNVGIDISALLTGLGIGGIAVALAAQNILGDLLASLSIILDKPFAIGDFIVSGNERGTVENIGIKTTRIRSLSGEQIVMSNKDLLESRILNFERLERRRCVQRISVSPATPCDVLAKISSWLAEIVKSRSMLRYDGCSLVGMTPTSIDFELVFFVMSSKWSLFTSEQESVLIEILGRLREENVEFAIPSQRIFLNYEPLPATRSKERVSVQPTH